MFSKMDGPPAILEQSYNAIRTHQQLNFEAKKSGDIIRVIDVRFDKPVNIVIMGSPE